MSGLSSKLFREACEHLVGGVNSPVRAFRGVGGEPLFIVRGKGSHIWDADGREYIDYVGSWGPLILGHAHPKVLSALHGVMKSGTSFGAPHVHEIELAKMVKRALPSIEKVRFVNSGTEATMSAIRLARGYTGRDKIIKFDGCYHGHVDSLLVRAGSGAATQGIPDSQGVPTSFAATTLTATFNDLESVAALFQDNADQIAAVIVEPVMGNMGCIPPEAGFLEGLRGLTQQQGALLIFDEVMTGFRIGFGGAQSYYKIKADLTCLGKIIGGGLPVGAYGGKCEIMERLAPLGPVYQAGTLSGNPLAMAAGIATLKELENPTLYSQLEDKGAFLEMGLKGLGARLGHPLQVNRVGSLFSVFIAHEPVHCAADARRADTGGFGRLFHLLLKEGVYMAPSAFEAGFISTSHSQDDLDHTVHAFEQALNHLDR